MREDDEISHATVIGEHGVERHTGASGAAALIQDVGRRLRRERAACVSLVPRTIFSGTPSLIHPTAR